MSVLTPLDQETTQAEEQQAAKEGYVHRMLVAFDIFINVALLRGQEDETISSHSARAAEEGKWWGIAMSWFLNLFQKDHGPKAQSGDIERAENVIRIEESSGYVK